MNLQDKINKNRQELTLVLVTVSLDKSANMACLRSLCEHLLVLADVFMTLKSPAFIKCLNC